MFRGERQDRASLVSSSDTRSSFTGDDSRRTSTYSSRRPLSAFQPLEAESSLRHSVSGGRGPPLTFKNSELRNALSLQAAQRYKIYMEGYLLVKNVTSVDGQPAEYRHEKFNKWTECFVQLAGTTLSIWEAAKLANTEQGLVHPSYVNITDAFVDFVGMYVDTSLHGNTSRITFYHVFALNSAGSNNMLFCYNIPPPCDSNYVESALLPEFQHLPEHNAVIQWLNSGHRLLQAWINAIRLASWEKVRLDEIYTGAIIRARLSAMVSMSGSEDELAVRTPLVRGRYEGWVNVRFMGSTEWRRCWMVLNDHHLEDEQPSFWRILRNKPGDRSSITFGSRGTSDNFDMPPPPPGTLGSLAVVYFYEYKKAKKPFASLWHVRHVFAVYPSCVDLVEHSSLFKVEGCLPQCSLTSATHRPRQTGWVMIMPESKVAQPRGDNAEMMKWIIAFMDAFHLYGRPNAFAWDARDPESPFFAYPIGPFRDRLFLDRSLSEYLDITTEDHLAIRRQLHDIMAARMRGEDTPVLTPLTAEEAPATIPLQGYTTLEDPQFSGITQRQDVHHALPGNTIDHDSGRNDFSVPTSEKSIPSETFPDPSLARTAGSLQITPTAQDKQPPVEEVLLPQSFPVDTQVQQTQPVVPQDSWRSGSDLLSASATRSNPRELALSALTMPSEYSRSSYSSHENSPVVPFHALSLNDAPAETNLDSEWSLVSPSMWRVQHTTPQMGSKNLPPVAEVNDTRDAPLPAERYTPNPSEPTASLPQRDSMLGLALGNQPNITPVPDTTGVPPMIPAAPAPVVPAAPAERVEPLAPTDGILDPIDVMQSAPRPDSKRLSDRLRMLPQIDTTPLRLNRRDEKPAPRPTVPEQAPPVQQIQTKTTDKPAQPPHSNTTDNKHTILHPTDNPATTTPTAVSQAPVERSTASQLGPQEFPSSFGHRRVADSRTIDNGVPVGAFRPGRSAQGVSMQFHPSEDDVEEELPVQYPVHGTTVGAPAPVASIYQAPVMPQPTEAPLHPEHVAPINQARATSQPTEALLLPAGRNSIYPTGMSNMQPNYETKSTTRNTLADTPRSTFVRLEPHEVPGVTYTPSGLVATASQEKLERSARIRELEAREAGDHLVDLPNKMPPPQAGLMGSIRPGERARPMSTATMPVPGSQQHNQLLMNMYLQQQQMMMMMGMIPPMQNNGYINPETMAAQQQAIQAAQQAYMQTMSRAGVNTGPQRGEPKHSFTPAMPYGAVQPGT